ncbi:hypothetical protein EVAR_47765_1 [Eumeta japonica]|uniref:Uncharacterized protein n=1 Tax=Eumeta variegata TaxID=151549 RepID=A0A4C1XYC2_EUMVA|nr:hypothetical protein EVAR_47765_1 [Eumeta japonica]
MGLFMRLLHARGPRRVGDQTSRSCPRSSHLLTKARLAKVPLRPGDDDPKFQIICTSMATLQESKKSLILCGGMAAIWNRRKSVAAVRGIRSECRRQDDAISLEAMETLVVTGSVHRKKVSRAGGGVDFQYKQTYQSYIFTSEDLNLTPASRSFYDQSTDGAGIPNGGDVPPSSDRRGAGADGGGAVGRH